jgi:thymidylate synthase
MPEVFSIVCVDKATNGIGYEGELIYNCRRDSSFFKRLTSAVPDPARYYNLLVCGVKTFQMLPVSFDMATRRLFVAARNVHFEKFTANSHDVIIDAIDKYATPTDILRNYSGSDDDKVCYRIFLIGGNSIYEKYISFIDKMIVCSLAHNGAHVKHDVAFTIPPSFCKFTNLSTVHNVAAEINDREVDENDALVNCTYTIDLYIPFRNHPEHHYIELMSAILADGNVRNAERTGTGTIGLFGKQLIVDLSTGYCPLLLSRKMAKNAIVHEFQWYLSGSTDVDDLRKITGKQKTVWDHNTSRNFLDSQGLATYPEGDIGPSYGHQYRHWGAKYINKYECYNAKGIDQVSALIKSLCTDPQGRRHIITLWNVADLPAMALPPCLRDFQFYLREGIDLLGERVYLLDVKADQRSSDFFLAGFWNVHQVAYFIYYIIDHMRDYIAHHEESCVLLTGKKIIPGTIAMNYGDIHIYQNHIPQCKKLIEIYYKEIHNNKSFISPQVFSFSEEYGFALMHDYVPVSTLSGAIN